MIGSRPSNAFGSRFFGGNVVFFGRRLRGPHPLPFGRGEVLSLPDQTLLVRLELGDALRDLLAQDTANPIHRRKSGRFSDGRRQRCFRLNALR